MRIRKSITLLNISRLLFLMNGIIWITLGAASLTRSEPGIPGGPMMLMVMVGLMFINAAAMLWSVWAIGWQKKVYLYAVLFILIVNIVLSVTDQVGIWDLTTLVIDLVLFGLLVVIIRRKRDEAAD